ncbi:NAD(P)-binding protein [candidate division KSB3 bacterium]|uniref:NAD(P)-binding protein n=1 Tax=candidate division KSB3 bacterium TaxID=2044937 RepID=A0A9D5JXA9_9BACT|nr:NAD(P)-binding protein [candidate division KSB3 bacterium]MBD3325436.1 NAD(P)-binding protein [candidate division KSB3 bacterium]
MKRIAIVGAGLTGLSAAYHLQTGYELFEKEREPGGLCRTMTRNGFAFDYTGHLLHLRQDDTKALIHRLLPDAYTLHTRKAAIYCQQRYLNYPFQANIHGLPPEIVKECIIGFVETLHHDAPNQDEPPLSFKTWMLQTFGKGIAKYFMAPYNQKLWKTPLDQLSADWVSWSIPKPTLDEFLNGALGIKNREFGYNPTFLYPKTGGVSCLPNAFIPHLNPDSLHYGTHVVEIDPHQQILRFNDDSTYHYDTLISTMPLKQLVAMLRQAPEAVSHAGNDLRYISVYDVNLGINRPNISDHHWIYFPEPAYRFYRVGFPMNFSPDVAPPGCSSMYVEVSAHPDESIPEEMLIREIMTGLQRCGLLTAHDEILIRDIVRIDCAYVLYDLKRTQALQTIFPYLHRHNIFSIGRYGAWEYNSMEGAILAGKQIAEKLSTDSRKTRYVG